MVGREMPQRGKEFSNAAWSSQGLGYQYDSQSQALSHVLIRGSAVEIVHSIREVTHKGVDR